MAILILAAVYPECRLSEKGMEYIGSTNMTETGKSCLMWDSKNVTSSYEDMDAGFNRVLFYEEHFINQDPSLHKNFCRNPTGLDRPWCFVDDNGLKMEFCRIRHCGDFNGMRMPKLMVQPVFARAGVPECKLSQKGGEYVGVKDKTISGINCIPWLDQDSSDGDRIRGLRKGSFSDELTSSHNFCRNPNGNPGGPWCNIKVPGKPKLNWEYCDVSFCNFHASRRALEDGDQYKSNPAECKQTESGREYLGLKNVTLTGKECQPWLSQTPNQHMTILHLPVFPDSGMDSRHNYCRNPDLEKEGCTAHS
ncbi:unnamed protein product, partial [Darwinula stevensoni]